MGWSSGVLFSFVCFTLLAFYLPASFFYLSPFLNGAVRSVVGGVSAYIYIYPYLLTYILLLTLFSHVVFLSSLFPETTKILNSFGKWRGKNTHARTNGIGRTDGQDERTNYLGSGSGSVRSGQVRLRNPVFKGEIISFALFLTRAGAKPYSYYFPFVHVLIFVFYELFGCVCLCVSVCLCLGPGVYGASIYLPKLGGGFYYLFFFFSSMLLYLSFIYTHSYF